MSPKRPEKNRVFRYFHLDQAHGKPSETSPGRAFLDRLWLVFADPASFNDPFDGLPRTDLVFSEMVTKHLQRIGANANPPVTAESLKANFASTLGQLEDLGSRILAADYQKMWAELYRVACFSEIGNNALMWSHYGRSHTGFAVEFDTTQPLFDENFFPIVYTETRPDFGAPDMIGTLESKSPDWRYEQEWRLVRKVNMLIFDRDRDCHFLNLDPKCVTRILIGWKCKESDLHLFHTFRSQHQNIEIVRMRPTVDKYLVEEMPFS